MKDILLDIIQYTYGLDGIDLVKIVGSDTETTLSTVAENKSVIVFGTFKVPYPELNGTFGMPNLNKLKIILGFDEYDENAKISMMYVNKNDVDVPSCIHFENKTQDFTNDYRLMAREIVEEKIKNVKFSGVTWDVEFTPSVAGIMRLKKQHQANSEEEYFTTKIENNDLKVYFGDHSTHSGNFVFQHGVSGKLSKPLNWPIKVFLSILDLPGDKVCRISDKGVAEITVDSGIANYRYLLPAQSK